MSNSALYKKILRFCLKKDLNIEQIVLRRELIKIKCCQSWPIWSGWSTDSWVAKEYSWTKKNKKVTEHSTGTGKKFVCSLTSVSRLCSWQSPGRRAGGCRHMAHCPTHTPWAPSSRWNTDTGSLTMNKPHNALTRWEKYDAYPALSVQQYRYLTHDRLTPLYRTQAGKIFIGSDSR